MHVVNRAFVNTGFLSTWVFGSQELEEQRMIRLQCQVVGATYANGWLIIVGASKTSLVPGNGMRRRHARRRILPRLGALRGDNTPTPALRGLRMITRSTRSYKRLLELFGGRRKKGKASSLLSL